MVILILFNKDKLFLQQKNRWTFHATKDKNIIPRAGGTLRGMIQAQDSVVALPSFLVLQPSTHTSEIFNRDNQHW